MVVPHGKFLGKFLGGSRGGKLQWEDFRRFAQPLNDLLSLFWQHARQHQWSFTKWYIRCHFHVVSSVFGLC